MKKICSFLSLVLAILCFCAPLTQAASAIPTTAPSAAEPDSLDFSSEDPYMLQAVLSPSDLLTLLLSSVYQNEASLTDAERNYLDRYFSEYLYYDELLSPSLVRAEQDGADVTVYAQSYSYVANNGRTVTYLPVRAQIGARTQTLSPSLDGQSFVAEFTELPTEEAPSVKVFYQGSVSLPKEHINRLVTMAYRDAESALATEQSMLQYTVALEEYQAYLRAMENYEAACLSYEQYLSALTLYENAVAEYEQNRKEWEAYHEKYEVYAAYLEELEIYRKKQEQYLRDYADYTAQSELRKAYFKNLNDIRISLHPMESLFLKPTDSKTGTLYNALQNSELVVMFEKYQDILSKNFGVKKETIEKLRADADLLNDLLGEYHDTRAVSEEKAFACYKENYDQICFLFNSLYQRMSDILKPAVYTLMCAKLELEYPEDKGAYKKWRIKNVLSHIYLICLCLDDDRNPDNTWTFYADDGKVHTYYFGDLLNQNLIISDSNKADPTNLSWLAEIAEATPPTAPTEPPAVQQPMPPASMSEPTPPTEVAPPTEPDRVEEPTPPSQSDHALVLRTGEICLAFLDGLLSEREELSEDPTLSLPECAVEKRIGAPSVFGARGHLLPTTDLSALPNPSEDSELLPLRFTTDTATYEFEGWSAPRAVSDFAVPQYRRTPRSFTATFVIDGQTVYQTQETVGKTPVFEGSTDKEGTEQIHYVFTTWDPPLAPIYADTEYVAQYREQTRTYAVTFAMANQSLTQQYQWEQIPTAPLTPPSYYAGGSFYEFSAWDKEFAPVTEATTYTALYRELPLATLPEGTDGTLTLAPSATGYLLSTTQPSVLLSELIARAVSEEKRLEILFSEEGVSVVLDLATLRAMDWQRIHELRLDRHPSYGTALRCFREDGSEISSLAGEIRITMTHGFDTEENIYLSAYYPSMDSKQPSVACTSTSQTTQWIAQVGVYYSPYRRFALTLQVGEHGQTMANATVYSAGEPIKLTLRPDANYRLSALTFVHPVTGATVKADLKNPIMPAWNAILKVEFAPIQYRIEFLHHGNSVVQWQAFGDTVIFPEIPMSFEEDGFFYTFIGWSSTASIVTGDMTYVANYYSIRAEDVATNGEGGAWRTVILNLILPLAIIVLFVLAAIITLPIVIVKRVRKKKKALASHGAEETNQPKNNKKQK